MAITEAADSCQSHPNEPFTPDATKIQPDIAESNTTTPQTNTHTVCAPPESLNPEITALGEEIYKTQKKTRLIQTDRLFAWLMALQWIAGIVAAVYITPRTWIGSTSQIHPHIWMAVLLGGLISSLPIALAVLYPGQTITRHVIAIAQVLWSSLLIHLTGGRIETHFHIFGSLAFLAFYLDWKVLIPATVVVALDHFLRGVFFPRSIFGTVVYTNWRWMEHAAWVVFEDCFLVVACIRGVAEMRAISMRTAELLILNNKIELVVAERTRALVSSEERFRAMSAASPVGIYEADPQGSFTYVNARWLEIWGMGQEEGLGIGWIQHIHPDDRERVVGEWKSSIVARQEFSLEFRILNPTGILHWVHARCRAVANIKGEITGLVGTVEEISDRVRDAQALMRGAYHDPLTELPNRAAFNEALERALAHRHRRAGYQFAILFLDLDRFKIVNDSLGHAIGDQLLIQVAARLLTCVRTQDMVARLGGDEFTVLVDDIVAPSDAYHVAIRIGKALSAPFHLAGQEVYIGCSTGIAISSLGYELADELLRDADAAMYRAKAGGRGRYEIFDRKMHEGAVDRLRLETDLRLALNRNELWVAYQPIMSLENDSVVGFEALARWTHPEHGMIGPAEFIPLAEDSGLIAILGNFVLYESCRWLADLRQASPLAAELFVSVNVSVVQFSSSDFLDQITTVLERTKLDPTRLKLEITETMVMQNAERAMVVLQRLRDIGIQLWVDDFGTGYSSLAYLHRLPIDSLKIDRSFVSGPGSGGEAIIKAILALAHSLHIGVIAEGVETIEQCNLLKGLDCRLAQGYFFSRPITGEAAAASFKIPAIELAGEEPAK
jgi:diguanylate cyclase (GGDEF)-like protein/PAS domain S-box-containing protein